MTRVLRLVGLGFLLAFPVAAALGWLVDGSAGAFGAVLGLLVPAVFLGLTVVLALMTAQLDPTTLGWVVLGSWVLKMMLLVLAFVGLNQLDGWSRSAFAVTFVLGVVAWLVAEAVTVVRSRVPYVD